MENSPFDAAIIKHRKEKLYWIYILNQCPVSASGFVWPISYTRYDACEYQHDSTSIFLHNRRKTETGKFYSPLYRCSCSVSVFKIWADMFSLIICTFFEKQTFSTRLVTDFIDCQTHAGVPVVRMIRLHRFNFSDRIQQVNSTTTVQLFECD